MKMQGKRLFRTIHPMTYFAVIVSMIWGVIVLLHDIFDYVNILNVGQPFWPEPVTYIWAAAIVIAGIALLRFFWLDTSDRDLNNIWIMSKIHIALWTFSLVAWIMLSGSQALIIVSLFNIAAFVYIAMASKFSRRSHRV